MCDIFLSGKKSTNLTIKYNEMVSQFAAFFEAPKIATTQKYPDLAGFVANGLLGKPNDRLHPFTPYSSKETVAAFHRIPSVIV